MAYKDILEERRVTANAIFHRFRTGTNPPGVIDVFVEGYDDVLHYSRFMTDLERRFGHHWRTHITYGKRNMDRVLSLFNAAKIEKRVVLFIRDSDFDRYLGLAPSGENVFLTCGYSVENYVCGRETLRCFFTHVLGVDENEVDIDGALDHHFECVETIFEWLSPFWGAIFEAIKSGESLDLDQLDLITHYKVLWHKRGALPILSEADIGKCKVEKKHFNDESDRNGRSFTQQEARWWLRGKYLIQFTCEFLKLQDAELRQLYRKKQIGRLNRRVSPDYSPSAVFERLSSFTPATDALAKALESISGQCAT